MIDTHCHLYDHEAFPDVEAVIASAVEADVERMVVIGIDAETSRAAIDLAERFDAVFATVGWHPNHAATYSQASLAELKALAQHPRVVAIGEIGLDFHWSYATLEQQTACLHDQLDWAAECGLPIVFHCREAYPALLDLLEARGGVGPCVFHCFGGDAADAERALAVGAHFGVDGPITYKKNDDLRSIFAGLPLDRVLVETDAPYLAPVPHRGKTNTPANIVLIQEKIAEIWQISRAESAKICTTNAERFFRLPPM